MKFCFIQLNANSWLKCGFRKGRKIKRCVKKKFGEVKDEILFKQMGKLLQGDGHVRK